MVPGAHPRDGYHHGDARNAFLRAALQLVDERGIHGFSLREAARVVGVSASAAYRHFADKEALLAALAAEGDAGMADAMRRAGAEARGGRDGVEGVIAELWAYAGAIVDFALAAPAYLRVMSACKAATDGTPSRMAGPTILALQRLDELIAMGAMRAEDRDRALIAGWAGVFGLAWMTLEGTSLADSPEFRRTALDAVLRTLFIGLGIDPATLPAEPPCRAGEAGPPHA
jgi:AcrR family transcriptional regulator